VGLWIVMLGCVMQWSLFGSEDQARVAARKIARSLEHLGFRVKFKNFHVVNVLGTCSMPFGIHITKFSSDHKEHARYVVSSAVQ